MLDTLKKIGRSLGPGLIVAAIVLGPGSITSMSAIGSILRTKVLWILVVSGVFMLTYTALAARFGTMNEKTFLTVVKERYGKWLSVTIGILAFLGSAGFQVGNNLGVGMAMNAVFGGPVWVWAALFTLIAISFLFFFSSLYQAVEKLMIALVVIMTVAFVSNLAVARPDLGSVVRGFVPGAIDMQYIPLIAAVVATTFSVGAALFQCYLVQEKNWGPAQLREGIRDSAIGITALILIGLVVMITASTVLGSRGIEVRSAADMAAQLEPLLGRAAMYLFCLGLWGASFSSFLGNAILAGTILSDGLGLGGRISSPWTKRFAIMVLLIGTAMAAASSKFSPINSIIIAQAVTVIMVPLAAFMILWLANKREIMGGTRPAWWVNVLGILGLIAVCLLAVNTAWNLIGRMMG
ncbi:MAG: divalent metal cation transporter [Candidatus Glassbacteria bacterium]|nr:divalent metal cation transporter [Candidatus Glassbacteria bacterium]